MRNLLKNACVRCDSKKLVKKKINFSKKVKKVCFWCTDCGLFWEN